MKISQQSFLKLPHTRCQTSSSKTHKSVLKAEKNKGNIILCTNNRIMLCNVFRTRLFAINQSRDSTRLITNSATQEKIFPRTYTLGMQYCNTENNLHNQRYEQ